MNPEPGIDTGLPDDQGQRRLSALLRRQIDELEIKKEDMLVFYEGAGNPVIKIEKG